MSVAARRETPIMDEGLVPSKFYDRAYQEFEVDESGLPDRKIDGGKTLKGKRILSVGCGTGQDIYFLTRDNEVYGIDSSETAVTLARRYGVRAKVGDLEKPLDFKDGEFDVIVCKDILEHLDNPLQLMKEIYRLLREDGYLVVNVPNHFYWHFRIRILFGKNLIWKTLQHDHTRDFKEWDYVHKRFFTYKGFLEFLKTARLKPVRYFWDFGTFSHYNDPYMYYPAVKRKKMEGDRRARRIYLFFYSLLKIYDLLFPLRIRQWVVGLTPGFFSSSFYCWCVREK